MATTQVARVRTVLLGLVDQAVSSGTNFLLLFLVVRTSGIETVGVFTLAYTLFFLLLGLSRGLVADPFTVRFAGSSAERQQDELSPALGSVLFVALASLALCGVIGGLGDRELRLIFWTMGAFLPALFLQEMWRAAGFAAGSPARALALDSVMAGVQVATYLGLFLLGLISAATLIAGWGVGALAAALWATRRFSCTPALPRAWGWLRANRGIGFPLALDYAVNRGAEQGVVTVVSWMGSLAVQGAITTTRTLFAPLTTIQTGLNAVMLPEISRASAAGDGARVRRLAFGVAGGMGSMMLLAGVLLVVMPDAWGRAALGPNWDQADTLLWPMTAFSVANAVAFGLWLGTRASGAQNATLRARAASGLLMVALGGWGAKAGGGTVIWGMTTATVLLAGTLTVVLIRCTRQLAVRTV